MNLQVKLLSALQNRSISRVGANKLIPIDIRLISATNKAIHELAEQEVFREDLLYRINTVEINVPKLKERKEDIKIKRENLEKKIREFIAFEATQKPI